MVSNYACTTASASSSNEDDCWRVAETNNNFTALPAYNASPGRVLIEMPKRAVDTATIAGVGNR